MEVFSARVTRQAFVVDRDSLDFNTGHSVDWSLVGEEYRVVPGQRITLTANVAADATSMTVAALKAAVPAGTLLNFGQAEETVRVTTDAAAGATSLAIDPAPSAIESGDSAVIPGRGNKFLKAGTVVGSLLGNGQISPRVASTNPAIGILLTDAEENSRTDALSGYGVIKGGLLYENLLPEATGTPRVLATQVKTELAAAGTGFGWEQYIDSSAS